MRDPTGISLLFGMACWWVLLGPAATAATLRAVVQVQGPTVRLSDLFAGLEPGQDCTLGDSPEPGTRLVVERPQLEAIASEFGVDWQSPGTNQTVVLDRAGRAIERSAVVSILRDLLTKQYGSTNIVVTLDSYQDQMIDVNARIDIGELSIDDADGRIEAILTASVDGKETLRVPLAGRIDRLVTLPVPTRPIAAGQVISDRDLSNVGLSASRVRGDVVENSDEGIGLESVRALPAGLPISRSDLRRPDVVFRGGPVMMLLRSNGIEVQAQGQALESGSLQDRVRVANPISHAVLLATVTGRNEVSVDPASMPFVQPNYPMPDGAGYSQFAGPVRIGGGEP